MNNSIFIQKTLTYAETDKDISLELLHRVLLMVGVDVRNLFQIQFPTKKTRGSAKPFTTKHDLLTHIQKMYFLNLSPQKTRKQVGGWEWTKNNQETFDYFRKQLLSEFNLGFGGKKTLFERFQARLHSIKSYGVMFSLSLILSVILDRFRVHSKVKHNKKVVDFFNNQLTELSKIEEVVQESTPNETYKKSNINLKFVDAKIHDLFETYQNPDELRYHLLRLQKKRSIFQGRSILKEHIIRHDGSVRESCGEMARAVYFYWENRHLLGILYNKVHKMTHTLKKTYKKTYKKTNKKTTNLKKNEKNGKKMKKMK